MKLASRIKLQIDRTTMYRTVLYVLTGLVVWSLLLAFVGLLDFNPLSMLLSLLAVLAAAFCVDRLLAYVFRVYPNVESIFITALILYFLVTPSGTMQNFVLIALAGACAAASKYLLAWRGRHVFNPAAAGVFMTGILGLGSASWWVATPVLLPFVLVGALMVLYKTRMVQVAVWYVSVATVTILGAGIVKGAISLDILWLLVASYPLVFAAGFMLSEPLTLAPKHAQRRWIAALIGVVSYVPFSVGVVSNSPELGLLVGNVAAALFARRSGVALTLTGRHKLTGDQVEYQFRSRRRLHFEAGQYIELHVPHARSDARGVRRMFTIASAPASDTLRIITRQPHHSSSYKKALGRLPIGATVRATGVWGDFVLPRDPSRKLLLIAGGVGITPFLSQLSSLNQPRDIVLLYTTTNVDERLDVPHSDGLQMITHEGAVTKGSLAPVADIAERLVYISGPPVMVDATTQLVRSLGATEIQRDFFAGY